MEQAGGRAISDLHESILEVKPGHIHERKPIYIGCSRDIDRFEKFMLTTKESCKPTKTIDSKSTPTRGIWLGMAPVDTSDMITEWQQYMVERLAD